MLSSPHHVIDISEKKRLTSPGSVISPERSSKSQAIWIDLSTRTGNDSLIRDKTDVDIDGSCCKCRRIAAPAGQHSLPSGKTPRGAPQDYWPADVWTAYSCLC